MAHARLEIHFHFFSYEPETSKCFKQEIGFISFKDVQKELI